MRGESKNLIEIINFFFFFFFLADPFFPDPSIYLSSNTINSALWQSVCTITLLHNRVSNDSSSSISAPMLTYTDDLLICKLITSIAAIPVCPPTPTFSRVTRRNNTPDAFPRILPAPIRIEPLESICRAFDALSTADIHTTHPSSFSWMGFRFGNCRMETGGKGDEGRKSDLVPIDRFFAFRI